MEQARTRTRTTDDSWLEKAFAEVSLALAPMPDGYSVEINSQMTTIMILSKYPEPDGLGFAISADMIRANRHVSVAIQALQGLVQAVQDAGGPADGTQPGTRVQ